MTRRRQSSAREREAAAQAATEQRAREEAAAQAAEEERAIAAEAARVATEQLQPYELALAQTEPCPSP